jgi:hypothetical protein
MREARSDRGVDGLEFTSGSDGQSYNSAFM